MKIQPIDSHVSEAEETRLEPVKPVVKSRLKRLFERQFSGVLRISTAEKISGEDPHHGSVDVEPSSVCLAKMVQSFMEENHEKHSGSVMSARNRYNCFNGNSDDSFEAESHARLVVLVTPLILRPVKRTKNSRKIVTDGLVAFGYDASICKSRWEKSPFCPAGEYEYIDVMIGKERVIVDVDFRSEFEIARSTKAYKVILQTLPYVFVGKSDRLQSIVAIASEAANRKGNGTFYEKWGGESEPSRTELVLDGSVLTQSESSRGKSKVMGQWKPPVLKHKSGLAAVFRENP
ncbi:hypothetical protein SESBI_06356 [Sesbania bispinosa]|nr:hypothetical protein SESBI_06356 [Sesbania bispinosa]